MNAALPLPMDVRLMNATASVLFALAGVMLVAACTWWAVRHPYFAIRGITVTGDVAHNNAATLRANVMPRLTGNYFTLDLSRARAAFEAVPWVRQAQVRREFPNRLRVRLTEHVPVAFWGEEGQERLLNAQGEIFEANAGDVEADSLPRLLGPQALAPQVLALYRTVAPLFDPVGLAVEQLALSGGGQWQVQLDNGAVVELGRGTADEVAGRTRAFVQTLTQVASRHGRRPDALESADLRHARGYALRLRGVTTAQPAIVAPKDKR